MLLYAAFRVVFKIREVDVGYFIDIFYSQRNGTV